MAPVWTAFASAGAAQRVCRSPGDVGYHDDDGEDKDDDHCYHNDSNGDGRYYDDGHNDNE